MLNNSVGVFPIGAVATRARYVICQPAHVVIVVNETRSSAVARFVPQDARVVYKSTEYHGGGYRAQNSHFNPLDAQRKGPLIVSHDSQRRRKCRHRAEKSDEHVAKGQHDE